MPALPLKAAIAERVVDLWPNLAKQVQTFWKFGAPLYFQPMGLSIHAMDLRPGPPNGAITKPRVIVWERHDLFIARSK